MICNRLVHCSNRFYSCFRFKQVVKVLLQRSPNSRISDSDLCVGRILVYNAMRMSFHSVKLAYRSNRTPITSLIDYQGFCNGPAASLSSATTPSTGGRTMDEDFDSATTDSSFHNISPSECLQKLQAGWTPFVVDVRLPTEHDIVALPFTDHVAAYRTISAQHDIPRYTATSGNDEKEKPGPDHIPDVLIYCKAGVRGKKACERLISQGVPASKLFNLNGGIMAWRNDIDPSMPRY
jgi:sulfur-carrier protein adenylyltransferase/sulfurtransferase